MPTDRLPDRWTTREYPVLLAAARRIDASPSQAVTVGQVAQDTGLSNDDVRVALDALAPAYLNASKVGALGTNVPVRIDVKGLTERGRRAVGLWPSGDGADALVDALRQAEDLTDDPDEKSLLRRAGGAVGAVSREVMTDVLAAVIARQSGLG